MGRPVRRLHRGFGGGLYRVRGRGPAPLPARHRRQHGPCPHARPAAHHPRGRRPQDRRRAARGPEGDRERRVPLQRRRRRHPHEHRAAAHREDRQRRREAAHRPEPQRPGDPGHAALPEGDPRRHPGGPGCPAARAGGRGPEERGRADARLHPPPASPAGALRAPLAGLRGDARAGQEPLPPLPGADRRHAPGLRGAGRNHLSHRPGLRGQAPGLPAPLGEQHRRGQRPGFRAGVPFRVGHSLRSLEPHGRRIHPVVQRGVRFHRIAGRLLHRQLDDAAEEEP